MASRTLPLATLKRADDAPGTKNGFGMHLLTITPDMFRRFDLVRISGC